MNICKNRYRLRYKHHLYEIARFVESLSVRQFVYVSYKSVRNRIFFDLYVPGSHLDIIPISVSPDLIVHGKLYFTSKAIGTELVIAPYIRQFF